MNELLRRLLALPPQASSLARRIDTLHYVVIGTAFVVAAAVFVGVVYMLVRFRERPGERRRTVRVPKSLELGISVVTLATFIGFWVVGFGQYRAIRAVSPNAMRIYVVAKQWMWEAVYPDGTAVQDDIRVPVGRPVVFLLTARDVIHSFYVPSFRLKQDVIPGRITTLEVTATVPGTYDILCAEYCGTGHSRMRGRVIALSEADYASWLASHATPDLAAAGEKLSAEHGCLRCHTVDGTPHLGPTWRGLYRSQVPLADGTTVIADEEFLTESMMDPNTKMHTGFQAIMPSYLGQLAGPETAAIVEYIRSLR